MMKASGPNTPSVPAHGDIVESVPRTCIVTLLAAEQEGSYHFIRHGGVSAHCIFSYTMLRLTRWRALE